MIVGSRFDDWVYWTYVLQFHLITRVHTLNSLITNLSLLPESWRVSTLSNSGSRSLLFLTLDLDIYSLKLSISLGLSLAIWISDWTNFMRTKYRSSDRPVDSPLVFSVSSVATKTCDNLRATLWSIQAYSWPRKRVLASRCRGKQVFT
jgi:hypothetical protein